MNTCLYSKKWLADINYTVSGKLPKNKSAREVSCTSAVSTLGAWLSQPFTAMVSKRAPQVKVFMAIHLKR